MGRKKRENTINENENQRKKNKKKKNDENDEIEENEIDGNVPRIDKKKYNIRCYKMSLNSIIKEEYLEKIQSTVLVVNDIVYHSYNFLKLFILQEFQSSNFKSIPNVSIVLIKRIMSHLYEHKISSSNDKELDQKIKEFYENYYQKLTGHSGPRATNIDRILAYSATRIFTEYSNNINEHFQDHFRRFINITTSSFKFTKKELYQLKSKILIRNPIDQKYQTWYNQYLKDILPVLEEGK